MATYILNEPKMFSDIADGIAIVIQVETGLYYGMNALGSSVYQNLINGVDSEEILKTLKGIAGAPDDIDDKISGFINKLEEFDIIRPGLTDGGEPAIDTDLAQADEFEMLVEEFNDAQEMLLADPIHEVREDTGWQPTTDARN